MIGFLIGTACLIGLIKTVRYGRCGGGGCGRGGYERGGCGRGGWEGHEGHGGGWGGHHHHGGGWGGHGGHGGPGRFMLRALFERLDTTPGQEKVIAAAFESMQAKGRELRETLQASRGDLARSLRGEHFDENAMGEAMARHNAALEALHKSGLDAVAKVHEALDARQRSILADMLERGPWADFRRGGGGAPYRF